MKNIGIFYLQIFIYLFIFFFAVKFSVYLNRRVFVMGEDPMPLGYVWVTSPFISIIDTCIIKKLVLPY